MDKLSANSEGRPPLSSQETAGKEEAPEGEAKPPAPKKWKLADQEFEDPDALATYAQKLAQEKQLASAEAEEAKGLRQYLQQAEAAFRKQQEMEARLTADPFSLLQEKGVDPYELALQKVRERMEEEALTPEQRAFKQLQREKAELEKRLKGQEEEKQKTAQEAYKNERRTYWAGVIAEAVKASGFPDSPDLRRRIADQLRASVRYGHQVAPQLLAHRVRQQVEAEHSSYDTDERFLANLANWVKAHPKRAEAVRRFNLEQLGVAPAAAPAATPAPSGQKAPAEDKGQERLTQTQLDRLMRGMVKGL